MGSLHRSHGAWSRFCMATARQAPVGEPPQMRTCSPARSRTLLNNEFGITEKLVVEIKADTVEKQIKDYSDRLSK